MISKLAKGVIIGGLIGGALGRRSRPQSQPSSLGDSYGVWICTALVMTGIDVLWLLLVWPLTFLVVVGAAWFLASALIFVVSVSEVSAKRRAGR